MELATPVDLASCLAQQCDYGDRDTCRSIAGAQSLAYPGVTCRGPIPVYSLLHLSTQGVLELPDCSALELRDELDVPGISSPG